MEKNSKPNPAPKKDRSKNFTLPRGFLNQLNEFSNGGYILIMPDEDGEPSVYVRYDSAVIRMGLQAFAKRYFNRKFDMDTVWAVHNDSDSHVSSGEWDDDFTDVLDLGGGGDDDEEDDDDEGEDPPKPKQPA